MPIGPNFHPEDETIKSPQVQERITRLLREQPPADPLPRHTSESGASVPTPEPESVPGASTISDELLATVQANHLASIRRSMEMPESPKEEF